MPAVDPPDDRAKLRQDLAKEARLWGLALVCATVGALVVWQTDSFWTGAVAVLACLGVGVPLKIGYERRRRGRR